MKRMSLLAFLLLPGLAGAQSAGQVAFTRACSNCHQAGAPSAKQAGKTSAATAKKAGPHLSEVLQKRTIQELRAWIESPQKVNKKTQCDTRLLSPEEVDLVLSYVATSGQPLPPPRDELLRQQLQKDLAELRRSRPNRPPETIETIQTSAQGKK